MLRGRGVVRSVRVDVEGLSRRGVMTLDVQLDEWTIDGGPGSLLTYVDIAIDAAERAPFARAAPAPAAPAAAPAAAAPAPAAPAAPTRWSLLEVDED